MEKHEGHLKSVRRERRSVTERLQGCIGSWEARRLGEFREYTIEELTRKMAWLKGR